MSGEDEFVIDPMSENPIPTPEMPPEMEAFVKALLDDGMSDLDQTAEE